jgi:hypothetical protein
MFGMSVHTPVDTLSFTPVFSDFTVELVLWPPGVNVVV